MSVEAMTWAFQQAIPPAPKIVLLALANEANKQGKQAFPSLQTLVENCAPMKKRTIQNHLQWLARQAQLITIQAWFTERGRQTSNLYELNMTTTYCGEDAESCTPSIVRSTAGEGAESCMGRVQKAARGRVQELLHGEGARAVAPSDKNLNLVVRPKERVPVVATTGPKREVKSAEAWEGYRSAYHKRYGVYPVRDARVNADLCRLVDRLGQDAGPVAAYYVAHTRILYEQAGHPTSLLLRDYQALRMQWKTKPIRHPVTGAPSPVIPAAYAKTTLLKAVGEDCPAEVAAQLSRLRGKTLSFHSEEDART